MEMPAPRWHEAITRRRSRRQFSGTTLDEGVLSRIAGACLDFRPFPSVRSFLVTDAPERVFTGAIGHYGKIKGATAFIAFIGAMEDPFVQERTGYTGEGLVLEATALGISTCWVGAAFRPEVAASFVELSGTERVLAVSPLGLSAEQFTFEEKVMTAFGRTHRRKSLAILTSGATSGQWAPWVRAALEVARLAPSAVNRQPWRFSVVDQDITVSVDNVRDTYGIAKRLDCGIAMLHIEVAARTYGVNGSWEFLQTPNVARWRVDRGHR